MREFEVAAGSATLRGSEVGDRDGDPIVFLHAGVADRRSWLDVMELMSGPAGGLRCVAYDQRGHGDTSAIDEPYSPRDDLLAVLADRGIDRPVLVGSSRGGQIALDAALAAPHRVNGLVLVGSAPQDAPFPEPPPEVIEVFGAVEAAEAAGDIDRLNELEAQLWLDGPLAAPGRVGPTARDLFLDMNGRILRAPPSGERAPFRPTWTALATLDLPVAVVVGAFDVPGLVAAAHATAQRIPDATFEVIDDAAHLPMLEHPARIAAGIRILLERRSSGS